MKPYIVYFIALITGGIGFLAYSPFDLWFIAYVSLIGLVWIVKTLPKKTALIGSFLWGLSYFSVGNSWLNVSIHQFGGTPLLISYLLVVLLAAYLSLYPLLFTYLIHKFKIKHLILFPAIWTITEFLRGWLFTGFPWLQFGYTQIDSPFKGIAPFLGVEGLTFFIMWVSVIFVQIFADLIRKPKEYYLIFTHFFIFLVISILAYFSSSLSFIKKNTEKSLNITLLQGNIEQQLKWDPEYFHNTMNIYQELINEYLGKSDVIILPESAFPTIENNIQPFLNDLQKAAEHTKTEVIIGSVFFDLKTEKLLNSMINLGNKNSPYQLDTQNRYSKHHLVPFGEYVPLETILRPLGTVFNLPMSNFQNGDYIQAPFLTKTFEFAPAICYEIIFGHQLQNNITEKTDFILTLSNDAWFGNSIGPWQHLQMARMRALELGKPVIRATNNGITAFINGKGNIISQAPQFIKTSLTHRLNATTGKTPYSILGSKPLYILIFIWIFLHSIGAFIRNKYNQNAKSIK